MTSFFYCLRMRHALTFLVSGKQNCSYCAAQNSHEIQGQLHGTKLIQVYYQQNVGIKLIDPILLIDLWFPENCSIIQLAYRIVKSLNK